MFLASPLCPSILVRRALFGFSADELSVVPRVFVYMLNVCKFCIWGARNDFCFRGVRPSAVDVMERVKSRVRFNLPLFFVASGRTVVVVILSVSGVVVVWWLRYKMMPWSFIFKFSSCVACTCPGRFFWGEPASWRWVCVG